MRFLTCYINPQTGRERLGTGGDAQAFHRYKSVENVIRFGLRYPAFPAGQYNIYLWPEGTAQPKFVRTAYKQA